MARQYTGNFSQWGQAGLTTGEETEVPQGTNLFSWSPDLPTPLNQTNPVGTEIPTNQKTYTNDSPQAQGHQFIPTLPRESILHMNDRYRSNPGLFSPDQIDELENHNIHYQIEFHRNLEDEEFKIFDVLKQAGSGFISGFTTLEVGDQPDNKWERIARNVGHLGGFVGFIPGASQAARISGSSILHGLAKLKGKSVPMLAAGAVTKQASKAAKAIRGRAFAGHTAAKGASYEFLHDKIATDVLEGAFHLGTASAVSSWTHGVDAMLSSAMHGAAFGGVFRSIGNFMKSGVKGEQAFGENVVGSIAGSLFQGLPSTVRGDTTPEQIAEYLMGAYFGYHETPYQTRTAQKYGADLHKLAIEKRWPADKLREKVGKDLVENKEGWDAAERKEIKQIATDIIAGEGEMNTLLQEVIEKDPTIAKKMKDMGLDMTLTEKGEIQALPEFVEGKPITDPSRLLELKKANEQKVLDPEMQQDTGTVIEYTGVASAVKGEAEKTLSSSWKKEGVEDLFLKRDKVTRLQDKLDVMAEKKDLNIDEVAKFIKKEFDYDITDPIKHSEKRAFYRNYLKRRVAMRPLKVSSPVVDLQYKSTMSQAGRWYRNFKKMGDVTIDELSPESPQNRAMNLKAIDSPILYIEEVYKRMKQKRGEDVDLDDFNQRPVERIDSFVMKEPHGNSFKEYKLSDLREILFRVIHSNYKGFRQLANKGGKGERKLSDGRTIKLEDFKKISDEKIDEHVHKEAQAHLDKFVGALTKSYSDKNMHYLSGRGDGDLSYYVKYHPHVEKAKTDRISRLYDKAKKMLKDSGVSNVDLYTNEQMNDYASKYGKYLGGKPAAKELFKKTYVSNFMWEMTNNGFSARDIFTKYNPQDSRTLPKTLKDGYINDVIKFNKRQQVWLTNGVAIDPEIMKANVGDLRVDNTGRVFARTIITLPPDKSSKNPWEYKATDMEEHFDGGTPTRTDFLDAGNLDAGHPLESGVLKTFGVSPSSEHGAMLLKHMHFDAGKSQSKFMEGIGDGIHFFTPESSAKQYGSREAYKVEYNGKDGFIFKDKNNNVVEPEIYEVPVDDLKTVLSEKTSDHTIGETRIPKQLSTNLLTTLYHAPGTSPVTKKVIDNWFKDFHLQQFHGTEEGNALLREFRQTQDLKVLDEVVNNLDNISTPEVVKLLVEPGYEKHSAKIYNKIAQINREVTNKLREEGELSGEESFEVIREADEYKGAVDKILKLSDGNDIGVWVHKITSPFRQTIVRNYIVNSITRPKMDNGMTARMQVYDWELQEKFPELQNDKTLYYLGDSMGKKNIKKIIRKKIVEPTETSEGHGKDGLLELFRKELATADVMELKKVKTLEDLWEYRNTTSTKKAKELVDNFFEAINVRIPMDSGSGAHVLKFGGFTGRKGYTVLMHPESMRALGGADSDGDKAFIFFDMKKEYKDSYKNARNEFVEFQHKTDKDKKISKVDWEKLLAGEKDKYYEVVSDNKEEFRDDFTKQGEYATPEVARREIDKFKNRALMYSPSHRLETSENAAGGRGNLGPAVVTRQVLGAAHSTIVAMEGNTHTFKQGPMLSPTRYELKARTDPKEVEQARKLARASIAFPSDPLDEVGLVHRDKAFKKVFEGFFEFNEINPETAEATPVTDIMQMRKAEFPKAYSNINSALFGKNREKGRAWDYWELKDKVADAEQFKNAELDNNMLAKIGDVVNNIHWYDDIMQRVNFDGVKNALDAHEKALENQPGNAPYEVAFELERNGFTLKMNEYTRKLLMGEDMDVGTPEYREALDFLSNDLHNLVGYQRGMQYWLKSREDGTLRDIGQKINEIMNEHYKITLDADLPYTVEINYTDIISKKTGRVSERVGGAELRRLDKAGVSYEIVKDSEQFLPSVSNITKQKTIDDMITEAKEGLSKNDAKSFDWLLISGFHVNKKGARDIWRRMNQQLRNQDPQRLAWQHLMFKTSNNRFAFNSDAISETNIKQFWHDYSKMFQQLKIEPPEAVKSDIDGANNLIQTGEGKINGEKATIQVEGLNKNTPNPTMLEIDKFNSNYETAIGDWQAFKRISEMKDLPLLGDSDVQLKNRILDSLGKHAANIGPDLEKFIRYEFNKEPDQMTRTDVEALANILEKPGTWFQETMAKFHKNVKTGKKDAPILSKWVHYMFPATVDRLWLSKESKLVDTIVPIWTKNEKGDWVMKPVKGSKPQHRLGEVQYSVSNLARINTDAQNKEEQIIMSPDYAKENLSWLAKLKEADVLHEIAILNLERPHGEFWAKQQGKESKGKAAAYRHYELQDPGSDLNKTITEMYKKNFNVNIGKDPVTLTGKELVDKIESFWKAKGENYYQDYVVGKKEHLDRYFYLDEQGNQQARVEDFVNDVKKVLKAGKNPHEVIQIGVDGMNKMSNHVMIRNETNDTFKKILAKRFKYMDTGKTENYWHHTGFDKAELKKALKTAMKNIKENPARTKKARERQVAKAVELSLQLRNITGNLEFESFKDWNMYDDMKLEIKKRIDNKESLQGLTAPIKSKAQNSRQLIVKGYDRTSNAGVKYGKSLLDTYYSNMTQIMGRETIRQFELDQVKKYKKDGKIIDKAGWKNAVAWKQWMEMYLNEAMGFPSVIPEHILNNKNMNLKGTAYHWFADSTVKNRINKIADALGVKQDKALKKQLTEYMDYNKLRGWTNLEAKYQLASLLAHPKTAIANIFGGSALTVQSAGFRHWRNARNHKFLRDNIDPNWTTKEDAGKWVESLGIVEQFLTYETGISPYAKDLKVTQSLDKLAKVIKKDPKVEDVTLKQIWDESGVGSNLFDKAAWFMRKSERMLRRDSFLAHYLQAKDIFGEAITGKGAKEHPFLIEWARRGVQDTQFLYTAAFRPAFARSALGKVMTRFQLWAWNSVRFRNKVLREAQKYGFKEGTPQFERYKRTASIDLFVFGLASAFTYSIFEANLPAPYNWIQDTADWLFGDEKTRDRAFFGSYPSAIAPLQMLTPPAARMIGPTMKAMIDDDWTKVSNYYIWTMFPFGRLARDVKNSVQNPIRTVENLTGVPYISMHRYLKETRAIGEETEKGEE